MSRNPPQSTRTAGQQTQTTDPDQAMAEDAQEGYGKAHIRVEYCLYLPLVADCFVLL